MKPAHCRLDHPGLLSADTLSSHQFVWLKPRRLPRPGTADKTVPGHSGHQDPCWRTDTGLSTDTGLRTDTDLRTDTGLSPLRCPYKACARRFSNSRQLIRHLGKGRHGPRMCPHTGNSRRSVSPIRPGARQTDQARGKTAPARRQDHSQATAGNGAQADSLAAPDTPILTGPTDTDRTTLFARNTQRKIRCFYEGCAKCFRSRQALRVHLRHHTGDRPYPCPHAGCDKRFSQKSNLQVHLRIHNRVRPFACIHPDCGKTFAQKISLQRHLGADCHKEFVRDKHRSYHKQLPDSRRPKPRWYPGEQTEGRLPCHYEGCGKWLTTAANLRVHMRIHRGEKPYACPREGCTHRCTQAGNLATHLRSHDKIKRFICPMEKSCGKQFAQKASLLVHLKRHIQAPQVPVPPDNSRTQPDAFRPSVDARGQRPPPLLYIPRAGQPPVADTVKSPPEGSVSRAEQAPPASRTEPALATSCRQLSPVDARALIHPLSPSDPPASTAAPCQPQPEPGTVPVPGPGTDFESFPITTAPALWQANACSPPSNSAWGIALCLPTQEAWQKGGPALVSHHHKPHLLTCKICSQPFHSDDRKKRSLVLTLDPRQACLPYLRHLVFSHPLQQATRLRRRPL